MLDETVIRRFSLNLTEKIQKDKFNLDMIWINEFSKELLKITLGENYEFPINIVKVAEELNLDIIEIPFVKDSRFKNDIANISISNETCIGFFSKTKQIHLNTNFYVTQLLQRVAIAYLLLKYLIHYSDRRFAYRYTEYHLFETYKEMEDLWIEKISYLLLMPIDLTSKKTTNFIKNSDAIQNLNLISYVANEAVIPVEIASIILNEFRIFDLLIN